MELALALTLPPYRRTALPPYRLWIAVGEGRREAGEGIGHGLVEYRISNCTTPVQYSLFNIHYSIFIHGRLALRLAVWNRSQTS